MVWACALWTTVGGKNFPPFLILKDKLMKELSIFIDESGDFGEARERPAYYLVTFVFHNQENNIAQQVEKLEESVKSSGFKVEYIHTGPVIRREEVFVGYSLDERRKLLYKMLNFVNGCPILHLTVCVDRKEAPDKISLSGKLAKAINKSIFEHMEFFLEFDKVIVYYDNGQIELSAILNAVFSIHFSNVEFRKAEPQKYRLLQAADFICSLELLRIKREEKRLSKSEERFFYKPQELKKIFLKSIDKKKI
jgi:hypothetical protein